jgi:hypothetical protein
MKDKLLKYLYKAQDEMSKMINDSLESNIEYRGVDLEYLNQQINDIIFELEGIEEIEDNFDDVDNILFDEYDEYDE